MLNGRSGTLVRKDGTWRFANDDGSTIERLRNASNGDNDGEHWMVTTTDGTQYFFGLNRLPGWSAGKAETQSAWTVPVFGDDATNAEDDAAEPCYRSTFSEAHCDQGWRWNLDYAKDVHGNVISYFYEKEINAYAFGAKLDVNGRPYVRGGWLKRIDYGQRDGEVYTTNAPARVAFTTSERCLPQPGVIACNPGDLQDATALHWQDTPTDRICAVGGKCRNTQLSPTFFTRKRLTAITTQVRADADWVPVNSWALAHSFTNNGDGSRSLWLHTITRSGWGGTTSDPLTMPAVTLEPTQLPNRIDIEGDMIAKLVRPRLGSVLTDTGGQVDVNYEDPDCGENSLPKEGQSTRRCYPVKWDPTGKPKPITDWFHKYVVRAVIETDRTGGAPDQVTRYDYLGDAGWRYAEASGLSKDEGDYLTWNQWRGYEKVRVTQGDGQRMTTRTEHSYLRGLDGDKDPDGGTRSVTRRDSTGTAYTDRDEFAAFEIETAVWNGTEVISKSLTSPWLHQTASVRHAWGTTDKAVIVAPESTRGLALKADGTWRETRSVTRYDTTSTATTGRVRQVEDFGDTSTDADDQCTTTTYADNPTLKISNLIARKETLAVDCSTPPNRATQVLADERTFYDGKAFGAAPTLGNVTRTEKLAAHDGDKATYVLVGESPTFDRYGRPTVTRDSAGTTTTTAYTEVNGLVTRVEETGPIGKVATEYAPALAQPVAQVDLNAKRTDLVYDKLGRVVQVLLPNRPRSDAAAFKFTYNNFREVNPAYAIPVSVKTERLGKNNTSNYEYQIYDGFLRPRQVQSEGPESGRLVAETFYTPTGKVAGINDTHFAAGAPAPEILPVVDGDTNGQTAYVYDGADRVTGTITLAAGFEKWRTTTRYDGADRVTVVPPKGGTTTTTITNARGQKTELWQYHGREPAGAVDRTRYTYTVSGQLSTVTDPAGNNWKHYYDQRGREIRTVDPDAGETVQGYDDLDRLTTSRDARGVTLSHRYDAMSRKTETWEGALDTGKLLSSWTFDRIHKGQLYAATRYVNGNKFEIRYPTRDGLYRALETQYVIPKAEVGDSIGGAFRFGTTYFSDGTVQTTSFPAAGNLPIEAVAYNYDKLQRLIGVEGTNRYVNGMSYSQTGELLKATLNTGGRTAWAVAAYERGTGRLTRAVVARQDVTVPGGPPDTTPVSDVDKAYRYDEIGNVLSIADTPGSGIRDIQCFQYDYLRRMTQAWTSAGSGTDPCAGGAAATGVGGVAPYHQSYTFDAVGNRKAVTQHGVNGAADVVRDYDYAGTTPAPAHGVGSIAEKTGTGDRLHTYRYDEAGNTVQRTRAGAEQNLRWDAEGNLASVTEDGKTTSFVYGADGERLVRKEPGSTTVYLGGMELRLNTATAAVDVTRFYPAGNGAMVVRSSSGLQFQFADHHGTGTVAVDAVSGAITHRRTDPYGNARGGQPAAGQWFGEKGFVGGNQDTSTGFIQLGARLYEPENGRFISVDPLIDVGDPQQMNAYAYANNSPVSYTDPAGTTPMATGSPAEERVYWSNPDNGTQEVKNGKWVVTGAKPARANTSSVGNSGNARNTATATTPTESQEAIAARERRDRAKQVLVEAAKALGSIIMEELGIKSALDCLAAGDIDGCVDTAINIASSFVGGMVTKLAGKYLFRFKKAAALGKKLWDIGGKLVDSLQTWVKENKLYRALMGSCHSFAAGTLVLLSDGSTKRIEDVGLGDTVVSTDPETGETADEDVVATHVHADREFTDLTVVDGQGHTVVLRTTQNHPFWSSTDGAWVDASELAEGDELRSLDHGEVRVVAARDYVGRRTMHDLTVATIHTYYVLAGTTPVLVHNCDFGPGVADIKYDKHVLGEGKKDGPDMPEYDYDGGFEQYVDDAKGLMCGDTCPAGATQTTRTLDGVSTVIRMDASGKVGMRVGNRITTYFRPDNPLAYFGEQAGR